MEEVMIDSTSKPANEEIVITDADLKDKDKQISTDQPSTQLAKRLLADKSEVETSIDGFGNKTETRYFKEHSRLKLVILRTSVDGNQEATVYGYGGNVETLTDLGDKALTASGNEIADAAKLYATRSPSDSPSFTKKRKTDTTLKPLPSSAFQRPFPPVNQTTETVQPETSGNSEKSPTQPDEEDED